MFKSTGSDHDTMTRTHVTQWHTTMYKNETNTTNQNSQHIQLSPKPPHSIIYTNIYTGALSVPTPIVCGTCKTNYPPSPPGQTPLLHNHQNYKCTTQRKQVTITYPVVQCNLIVNRLLYNAGRIFKKIRLLQHKPDRQRDPR